MFIILSRISNKVFFSWWRFYGESFLDFTKCSFMVLFTLLKKQASIKLTQKEAIDEAVRQTKTKVRGTNHLGKIMIFLLENPSDWIGDFRGRHDSVPWLKMGYKRIGATESIEASDFLP